MKRLVAALGLLLGAARVEVAVAAGAAGAFEAAQDVGRVKRPGATRFDAIHGLFALTDLHLAGVIGVAIAVSALGFWIAQRLALHSARGEPLAIVPKPMHRGVWLGGALFGVGWALTGTCPGTALAQLGEGTMLAAVTLGGILLGMRLEGALAAARAARRTRLGSEAPARS